MTGSLQAVRAREILVPRTPQWQVQIRWMAEDGTHVRAGQKVLEFDNSTFAATLEDQKLAYAKTETELARQEAEGASQSAEKAFQVDSRLMAVEQARLDADVPPDLLPLREYQEKQLALEKARAELLKAEDDRDASVKALREDLAQRRIAQEKARRQIQAAEQAVLVLTVLAPTDGILIVSDHRWEGRKVQVGDIVQAGWRVMQIPDLSEMMVEALLSDVDDGRVSLGMSVSCVLDAHPDRTYRGKVTALTPVARETSPQSLRRAFHVTVVLEEPSAQRVGDSPEPVATGVGPPSQEGDDAPTQQKKTDAERMRPGMSVKVQVERQILEAALLAPREALDLSGEKPRVRLANGELRDVRIGPCNELVCVIEEGLAAGTRLRGEWH